MSEDDLEPAEDVRSHLRSRILSQMKRVWVVALLLSGATGLPQRETVDVLPTSITLERGYCFGSCPVYKVTLRPSGSVFYEGIEHVEREGKYRARISPWDYKKLAALARKSRFYSLSPRYTRDKSGDRVTDQPSTTTRIVLNGTLHEVYNYGEYGPIELWGLEQAIDNVIRDAEDWVKDEPFL